MDHLAQKSGILGAIIGQRDFTYAFAG